MVQVGEEVLGTAAKVEVSKESTTIVGDGSTEDSVKARVRTGSHRRTAGVQHSNMCACKSPASDPGAATCRWEHRQRQS